MVIVLSLFSANLWFSRHRLSINHKALSAGLFGGAGYGLLYWRIIKRRIERRDRKHEANKVFVRFLSMFEAAIAFGALGYWFLFALGLVFLFAMLVDAISGQWWSILISGFAIGVSGVVTCLVLLYEKKNGPLYYQYDNRGWLGREGMLYKTGKVVKSLKPKGTVTVENEIWMAVSACGGEIEEGAHVEVISMEGLVLTVDRIE